MKKIVLAFTILSLPYIGFAACTATWQGPGTLWGTSTNWSPNCVPGLVSSSDTATFSGNPPTTIEMNVSPTLLSLHFAAGNTGYAIQNTVPPLGQVMNFALSGSTITSAASNPVIRTIDVPVNINGDTTITIDFGPGNNGTFLFGSNSIVTITGATFTNNSVNPTQDLGALVFDNAPVFSSGTLANNNNLTFTGANVASSITVNGITMTVGSGSAISNTNSGNISISGTTGTLMDLGTVTLNGGNTISQNTNSGSVGDGGTGSELIFSQLNISSGTLQNTNTGTVAATSGTPTYGSFILVSSRTATTMNVTGGLVINNNTGSVDPSSFGSLIQVVDTLNLGSPGGTIINNDTFQASVINITSGGLLSGTGLYTGISDTPGPSNIVSVTNGGSVEPSNGTTPGTLTINGTYSQSAGTLIIDLLSDSSASQLNVLGTASMGGSLVVDFLSGNTVSGTTPFTIVQATTLNAIQFDNVTFNNIPLGLTPNPLQYNFGSPGTIILSFSGHRINPSSALPTTYAGGFIETVLSDINHLNSHITIKMEDLRGRFSAGISRMSRIRSNFIASADNRFLAFNPETEEKQEQLRREIVEEEKVRPGSFYFGPTGRAYGEIHAKDGDPGAHYWSVGGLMGVDYAFSEVGIGAMADYERIFVHAKDNWGSIEVDEIHASIYLTYAPMCLPELAINAIGGGAYEFYNIKRNTSTGKVRGKPNGFGYDALFGFEYALGGCNFHFIPLANAQYIYLRAEKFNEKGSAGIHIDSQRVKSLRSSVGFRLNYYNETNEDLIVIPEFYAEWQREYMNRRRGIGIAPIAGIGGTILLPGTGRNIWLGGVDLLFTYRQKFGVEVSYETEYNSLYHDHFFYLGANARF